MRNSASYIILALIIILSVFAGSSCRKQRVLSTGGKLEFSVDTLEFDTVFTKSGSFTTGLVIYNPQNEEVHISSVRLLHGDASAFHLNVNGFQGNNISNLKIPPHDSIYVFATVNIDPQNPRTPFLVTDSLVATLNSQDFYVSFTAYGQNANYVVDSVLTGNLVWDTTLPYVIINTQFQKAGGAFVDPSATLTLKPGCRIYMHQNAGLVVFGKLIANGTKKDSIIFQGDRLDRYYFGYEGYPGEWGGIYFDSYSSGNKLTYTRLENCGNAALGVPAAIWVAPDSTSGAAPQVTLDHCTIKNSIGYGIYSFQGTVKAINTEVSATASYALAILRGGKDTFTNCTFANYGGTGLSHGTSGTVAILNFYSPDGQHYEYGDLGAVMTNCIVYGSLDSEIACSAAPNAAANLVVENCLLKMGSVREDFVHFNTGCIFNQDPMFENTAKGKYQLKAGSPAIDKGLNTANVGTTDLDNNPRVSGAAVDIGAYEAQ